MDKVDLRQLINPIRRQVDFLQASLKYRFLLYGGARGPGKSYILRWGMIWRLVKWNQEGHKNVRVALFSKDYPTLRDRQVTKIKAEFPSWLGELKTTQTDGLGFYLREEYGGGVLCLRNLDDASKYVGAEFAGIGVEELTESPKEVFDTLRGSLRWPGITDTFFWGATNPLGIGILWVRDFWIDGVFAPEMQRLAPEFHYIKALPSDNPHLTSEYWDDLRSQPAHIRKAWIEGDWYSVAGSVFDEWREDLHVLDNFKPPPHWIYIGCMDWGMRAPGCFVLFACGPEGEVVGVEELYFRGQHAKDVGKAIAEICQKYTHIEYIAADENMWYDYGGSAPNLGEECQQGIWDAYDFSWDAEWLSDSSRSSGPRPPVLIKAKHGPGSALTKAVIMHRYLSWTAEEDGTVKPWNLPQLRFTRKCKHCIRTIPVLPADKKKLEEVDTKAEDHCFDAVSYFLLSRPRLAEKPREPLDLNNVHPGLDAGGRRKKRQYEIAQTMPPHRQHRPELHPSLDDMVQI